nr:hypothetical protein OHA15_40460 [Streptomyces anthocyanicus]
MRSKDQENGSRSASSYRRPSSLTPPGAVGSSEAICAGGNVPRDVACAATAATA